MSVDGAGEAPTVGSGPGTYLLLLESPAGGEVRVGKLGTLPLTGGWLAYVGSAFGPGGLRARVGCHLSRRGALHWHVDYLLRAVEVAEVWITTDPRKREEEWVEALRSAPGSSNPLRGFGAGDCGCDGHLFRLGERPELRHFRAWLGERGVKDCEMEAIRGARALARVAAR